MPTAEGSSIVPSPARTPRALAHLLAVQCRAQVVGDVLKRKGTFVGAHQEVHRLQQDRTPRHTSRLEKQAPPQIFARSPPTRDAHCLQQDSTSHGLGSKSPKRMHCLQQDSTARHTHWLQPGGLPRCINLTEYSCAPDKTQVRNTPVCIFVTCTRKHTHKHPT